MKKPRNEMIEGKLKNLVVPGWIFSDLKLKGDKALIYAALYATRGMKILVSEIDVISRHLNICESTFHKIRAEFEKNGLIEVTTDDKAKYFSVTDRTLVQTEKISRISARYEETLAVRNEQHTASIPEKIPQNVLSGGDKTEDSTQLDIFETAASEVAPVDISSQETICLTSAEADATGSAGDTGEVVSENLPAPEQVPTEDSASQQSPEAQPEPGCLHNPEDFTKEKFCKYFRVHYDGTEDTDGIDWYLLGCEFAVSEILKSCAWARILRNVCKNKDVILSGYYSDEAVRKRRADTDKSQPRTDGPDPSER